MVDLFATARKLQGTKQLYVARELGITQGAIANFEAGRTTLGPDTLQKYAKILNINPLFISGESQRPFKSDELIKMRLPETLLGGIDYSIIYFLSEHNKILNLIFFITASPLYSKFLRDTVFGYPVFAIAIQDSDNNVFLLRRRKSDVLIGEREIIVKLEDINKKGICKTKIYHQVILAGQEKKFKDFSITKKEIDDYFLTVTAPDIVTSKQEDDLIKFLRANNIDPATVIELLFCQK